MMNLLRETRFKQAKPAEKAYKLFDGGCLFLPVTPQSQKWWRFKYRFAAYSKCCDASGLAVPSRRPIA